MMRVQDEILSSMRDFLRADGFIEMLAPIVGPVTDPGSGGLRQASINYYGLELKLMSSIIFHKQMVIPLTPKVFALSPNVRLEPLESIRTRRHLVEFKQMDVEQANASYEDVMKLMERMLQYVIKRVKSNRKKELQALNRELKVPSVPFKRYTYEEAIEILRSMGFKVRHEEIPWEAEEALSIAHEEPFWITNYPIRARAFYYLEHEDRPGFLKDFDLMYPEGYGEAASGGEREHRYEIAVERMRRMGEDPLRYGWYLEMLKVGIPPSAGFGIGIERLTRYVCGIRDIWEATPFPKVAGLISP